MPPRSIAELRHQHLQKLQSPGTPSAGSASNGSGVSASTTILERIKGNQASRSDAEACVFQKLLLDTKVIRQLQDMKEFTSVVGDGEGASPIHAAVGPLKVPTAPPVKRTKRIVPQEGPSIYIPVNAERVKIADLKDALKDEYAARYCELIGVAPSQQNMTLLQKLMPFEKCRITQSTQRNGGIGRSERRNNVVIQPAYHAPKPTGPSLDEVPFELLSLEMMQQQQQQDAKGRGEAQGATRGGGEEGHQTAISFEDYKTQFVFPFNLKERFEVRATSTKDPAPAVAVPATVASPELTASEKLAMQDALLAKLRESAASSGGAVPGFTEDELRSLEHAMKATATPPPHDVTPPPGPSPKGSTVQDKMDAMIRKELSQPWISVEGSEIRNLQLQFVRDFPFFRFEGRLSEAQLLDIKSKLIADDVTDIIAHAMKFVFAAYIAPLSSDVGGDDDGATVDAGDRDRFFMTLVRQVLRFLHRHQHSSTSMEEMPLFLLETRVVISAVLCHKLPTFTKCQQGKETLRRIDGCLRALLDPFGLQSHVVVVESTPQAQKVLRSKRLPQRMSTLSTSPLIQFIIGDDMRSTEAKRLARSNTSAESREGLEELKTHLTPSVRAELLQILTSEKLHRDL
jgi:hypothetical protein